MDKTLQQANAVYDLCGWKKQAGECSAKELFMRNLCKLLFCQYYEQSMEKYHEDSNTG